jgi:transcriptional regulator with XRE-family HTH domain
MDGRAIGHRLRTLRERRGLTRRALAAQASVSAEYVKKIEAGERLAPSIPVLARMARALGAELRVALVERRADRRRPR